ncbi:uncharacterized protein LOC144715814 isoform X1 [Wolffia australiana]
MGSADHHHLLERGERKPQVPTSSLGSADHHHLLERGERKPQAATSSLGSSDHHNLLERDERKPQAATSSPGSTDLERGERNPQTPTILALFLLLLSLSPPTSAILHPIDFLALQSLPDSLSSRPFFSSWDFSSDPCSFPGVLCSQDRVVSLSLGAPHHPLSGRLPPSLSNLSSLSSLSLSPGLVSGPIPDLSPLQNLRFLALPRNRLTGHLPLSLTRLPLLQTLDLSFNLLHGGIPPTLAGIPPLQNLVLSHNRFSGELPPFTAELRRLDLKKNNFSGELPRLPSSLRYLSLAGNGISGGISAVGGLRDLRFLDMTGNRFSGGIPPAVFGLPLESLRLGRNRFSGEVTAAAAVGIPAVDLSFNRLSGGVPAELSTVRRLYLNNNGFTGEVPGRMVERVMEEGMDVLFLQHNFLTGIQLNPSAEIPPGAAVCLQYNCMVPPVAPPCPVAAGAAKSRPAAQCVEWRGR